MRTALLTSLCIGFSALGAANFITLNAEAASPDLNTGNIQLDEEKSQNPTSNETCLSSEFVKRIAPTQRALLDREAALTSREAELENLERVLKDRMASIETSHKALKSMSDKLDASATDDITHLVKMYSSMKPKKAASIFDKMDPAFAAGFIREIEGARAGLILSEMNIQQSYRVSLLIANRQAEWRNGKE